MGYITLDGQKLQRLRADKKRHLTQKQVAAEAGVSPQTYIKAENGLRVQVIPAGKIAAYWGYKSVRSLQPQEEKRSA